MKKAIGWLVAAVLVVGGGFLGDHLARNYVENRTAEALAKAVNTQQPVGVGLGGWPFSLAFLTQSVPQANLSMASVNTSYDGRPIFLSSVEATSGTVQIDDAMLTASNVAGTAKMSYFGLGAYLGKSVTPAEDGRLKFTSTVELWGHEMTAAISARPVLDVDAQVIRFDQLKLLLDDSSGDVAVDLSSYIFDQMVQSVEIHLPDTVRVTSFTAGPDDVQVGFVAAKVTVPLR
jgi:hypothetical protein